MELGGRMGKMPERCHSEGSGGEAYALPVNRLRECELSSSDSYHQYY